MHDPGKSDRLVVPAKLSNKAGDPAAETVEGSSLTTGKPDQQNASRTQCREIAPSALDRIRQLARKDQKAKFTALFHHLTIDRLRMAFFGLNRRAAAGSDGVTWEQYESGLEDNLRDLHDRLARGAYRARPSRRVFIPKADGRLRPLGIAALEDKVVQRATVEVMNAIYETDFLGFSYGFRPGRSPHDALDALATAIKRRNVNYVLDADIRGYFDAICHEWLAKFIEHRIGDKRLLRLIQKWLKAGVMADGKWTQSEEGTPQGATVSPLLANIYLHYVLDLWLHQWRRRHAKGDVVAVRFADDFIVGFEHREDARRFLADLHERLRKFGLELHPDKTRLLTFGKYASRRRAAQGAGKPETFNFLGFTHICGKKKKSEGFLLLRHTMRERMRAKLKSVKAEIRRRMHLPIPAQGKWLRSVVEGFFQYHAVPTNGRSLLTFRLEVLKHWQHALNRRSQRGRHTWPRMNALSLRWLPSARNRHPWPDERFDVKTRGRSPVR
jgi:group II intron reverse transcriptase/maturase